MAPIFVVEFFFKSTRKKNYKCCVYVTSEDLHPAFKEH